MFDVTHKTNNEKRPLGVFASIDQNMEVFTPMRVFMPSECQWVFNWIIGSALPSLLGTEPLLCTQIFLCDGDQKIYRTYDQHKDRLMPNSDNALCNYHLVNKQLELIQPDLKGKDTPPVKGQQLTFKLWLFTWMGIRNGVEDEETFSISDQYLKNWLQQQSLSNNNDIKHNSHVLEKFLVRLYFHKLRWFFPYRKHRMSLGHNTTSPLEGGGELSNEKNNMRKQ